MPGKSIRRSLTVSFVLLITGTMLICILMNRIFLEPVYQREKQAALEKACVGVRNMPPFIPGYLDDDTELFHEKMKELHDSKGISVLIVDERWDTIFSTVGDLRGTLLRLQTYAFRKNAKDTKKLKHTEFYDIYKTTDPVHHTGHLDLVGITKTGRFFVLSSPMESVREGAAISTEFFLWVGIPAILLSSCIVWLLSRYLTKGIISITDLSVKMASLDFSESYEGKEENEIGILGANMNRLSEKLRVTIDELRDANQRLQDGIEEKTREEEIRREFLSDVSHELKTPISLVQGYAEGLRDGIVTEEEDRREYAEIILEEAERMDHLVKRLLDLVHLESGERHIHMESFSIREIAEGQLARFRRMAGQKGIHISLQGEDLMVWTDRASTEDVLQNYISNALHYAEGESPSIRITLEERGSRVRVNVWNSGKPIPEKELPKIWEKFYRIDKSRSRSYGGNGIGLSLVKAFMERMGEAYGVENTGDGVRFWFEVKAFQGAERQ